MNDLQEHKIKQFVSDEVASGAIYDLLLNFFIKPKPMAHVNEQAASFIAIGLLQDAWKELEKYKTTQDSPSPPLRQVGL